jgi:hypothetical protein
MINALIIHGKGTGGSKYEVNFPDLWNRNTIYP